MNMMHGMHYEKGKLVPNRRNPIRAKILTRINEAVKNNNMGDAISLNQEFMSRSRGKGRK